MPISTTNLETSKLLKEAGLNQTIKPGDWYWVEIRSGWKLFHQDEGEDNVSTAPYRWCKAFLTDELLAELPADLFEGEYRLTLTIQKELECFNVFYHHPSFNFKDVNFESLSLPEALAICYLWLKKENLI